MSSQLLPLEVYDDLPDTDEECFVKLENIARTNMEAMVALLGSEKAYSIQQDYMVAIKNLAEECRLPSLSVPNASSPIANRMAEFSRNVDGLLVRLRVRNSRRRDPDLVSLTPTTRTKIEYRVSLLDEAIRNSTLPDDRKEALLQKLAEIREELDKPQTSFGKIARLLVPILLVVTSMTTIGADGPDAARNFTSGVTSILSLMGEEKQNEEEARLRLPPPPRALPAPSVSTDEATST